MQNIITNARKIMIKIKNIHTLNIGMYIIHIVGKYCKKLSVNNFDWIRDTFQFNENFIKIYNEEKDDENVLEVDVQYPEKLHELHSNLPIFTERMKTEKVKKLVANLHDRIEYIM